MFLLSIPPIFSDIIYSISEGNSLEDSLTALGNDPSDRFDSLPLSFTPELQEKWKIRIEKALLNGIKNPDNKELLLKTITKLTQRRYNLNNRIDDPDSKGYTLFCFACQQGYSEMVELLLTHPQIDVKKPTYKGGTPFFVACGKGHSQMVELLLKDQRIDPNTATNQGTTPFFIACQNGHYEVVKLLLKDSRINPNTSLDQGATPFYIACQNGHYEVVELLLKDPRINLNYPHESGMTPFYVACHNGHIRIIKLLLKEDRVDVNKEEQGHGNTPFSIVCKQKNIEGVKLLIKNPRLNLNAPINQQQFAKAVESNEMELVELFLAIASRNQELREWIQAEFRNNRDTWINNECLNKEFPELLKSDASEKDFRKKAANLYTKHFVAFKSAAIFAAFVLLSDGFVRIKSEEEMVNATQEEMSLWKNWKRLSKIAESLPMDLQMVVALRALDSGKNVILSKDSEEAFRDFFKHCPSSGQ